MSSTAPVRLYINKAADRALFRHIPLLYPFWGVPEKSTSPFVYAAMQKHQFSKDDFALAEDIHTADFALIPYPYWHVQNARPDLVSLMVREAKEAKIPILTDASGDIEFPVPIKNSVVLRVSQYRYQVKENELTIPFFAEDLLEAYLGGKLEIRKKAARPSVGFVGWAELPLTTLLKTHIKELPITLGSLLDPKKGAEHKGVLFRAHALQALIKSRRIDTNLVVRSTYSGHAATVTGSTQEKRTEFVNNLLSSDYALIVRGDANSSVRFYEALSVGRIPLFLDTACVLPLENKLNYQDFCVFIDWKDVDMLGEKLADFHAHISSQVFEDMQYKARAAFAEYLRMDAFSKHLADELRERLKRFSYSA